MTNRVLIVYKYSREQQENARNFFDILKRNAMAKLVITFFCGCWDLVFFFYGI